MKGKEGKEDDAQAAVFQEQREEKEESPFQAVDEETHQFVYVDKFNIDIVPLTFP